MRIDPVDPACVQPLSFDSGEILGVSVHVVCELRAGAELTRKAIAGHEALARPLSGLLVAYPADRFTVLYARLLAATRRSRVTIASMDLMIGTTACWTTRGWSPGT